MLAEFSTRRDLVRTPTAELAGKIDHILDARTAAAALDAVPKAGKSLLSVLRRLFEPGAPSSN